MKILRLILVITGIIFEIAVFTTYSYADWFQPSHSCHKPIKPYSFTDQWQIDNFKLEVERYRRCIEDFLEEQKEAIRKHRDAVNEAIEEWNSFVRYNY